MDANLEANLMIKTLGAFVAAVIATYLLGSLFVSQGNLASIQAMGLDVTLATRLQAALHDMTHMYDIYLPLVVVGQLIGFLVAALVIRFLPHLRLVGYVLAGFTAMVALHVIMKQTLGMSGIAATRTLAGLVFQGVAGAMGGYVFWLMTRTSARSEP